MKKFYFVAKYKTNALGFWKDNQGKIFIDKIHIKECYSDYAFLINKRKSFLNGEKAIFYIENNFAIIESENGEKTFLKNCIRWKEKKLNHSFIKELLNQHNGFTIIKNDNDFIFELWKE